MGRKHFVNEFEFPHTHFALYEGFQPASSAPSECC